MKVGATHKDIGAGAARLLSAGILRRKLRCQNLRNPYPVFYLSPGTARDNREEGEDDTKSAWPFDALGCTRGTMAGTMGCQVARRS